MGRAGESCIGVIAGNIYKLVNNSERILKEKYVKCNQSLD